MKKFYSFLLVVLISFAFSSCGQKDYKRINEIGVVGVGIIDKIEDTNVTINDDPQVRIYVTVYSLKEEPFESVIKTVVSRYSFPQVGNWMPVKYDPKDKTKIIWVEDEDISNVDQSQIDEINETF